MNQVCFVDLKSKYTYCKGTVVIEKGGVKFDKQFMNCNNCAVRKTYQGKEYKYFIYTRWLGNLK